MLTLDGMILQLKYTLGEYMYKRSSPVILNLYVCWCKQERHVLYLQSTNVKNKWKCITKSKGISKYSRATNKWSGEKSEEGSKRAIAITRDTAENEWSVSGDWTSTKQNAGTSYDFNRLKTKTAHWNKQTNKQTNYKNKKNKLQEQIGRAIYVVHKVI